MTQNASIFLSLAIALLSGLLLSRLAKKVKLPAVTAYLIAGVLIGPFVLGAFGIPGIGNLFTNSIVNRDYSLILGITVFFAVLLVLSVLVVDIVYMFVDPRIKFE